MNITVQDRAIPIRTTRRQYTDEGFLRVPGRVARTGIQEYTARELGLAGDPNRVIKVYRPPEEVFHADSLETYDGADVTNNHPTGLVTADNFRNVTVGVVRGAGVRDGDWVVSDLIIKDKSSIDAINSGKCELSAGYTATYDETPGVTPDGEKFDMSQSNIRINHIAIVGRARAGSNARVFDQKRGNEKMSKITLDSGKTVDVQDEVTAILINDHIDRLNAQIADANKSLSEAQAAADDAIEKLEAEKKLTSDEAIKARVTAITSCLDQARKIAGDKFVCDSADVLTIMRSALKVNRPAIDWADKSDAYVQAAWDIATSDEIISTTKDSVSVANQLAQLSQDASEQSKTQDSKPSAYQEFKDRQANAWKGE